ncbi:MAG: flavin oxidoreductase [Chitinophagaceae bacterium]|nr:flavin oxidoreductase [Chitinophagaceae bacterium]
MIIQSQDIVSFEQRYRTAFINSLAGFRQAVLVGTASLEGETNLAIFNSLIHLWANPALFGLVSRPDTVPRDTLQNIIDTKVYTLNYVASEHMNAAHQTSARYAKTVSEFDVVGFTPEYFGEHPAPFVAEAVVKIGMRLEQTVPIELNGTILIIGSVQYIEIPDALVGSDGFVDLAAAEVLVSQGLDAYFAVRALGRLPYAKP